jgi:serine protease AprX
MDAGTGRPYTYLSCFEFFLAPFPLNGNPMVDGRPDLAPHVMNNSWGCPDTELCQGDVLLSALTALRTAGVFVVVSAGNSGPSCSTIQDSPAWHSDDTFSVGAYDHRNGRIAGFSSRGPSLFDGAVGPDLVAPGVGIRSAVTGGGYQGGFWSGTSMAGPHAVGVVALMWSAQPNLIGKLTETMDILRQTADPVPSAECMTSGQAEVPNNVYGYGRINAYKAVKASLGL